MKAGITGLGGVFFKSEDPKKLTEWYAEHLGLKVEPDGHVLLRWNNEDPINKNAGMTSPHICSMWTSACCLTK